MARLRQFRPTPADRFEYRLWPSITILGIDASMTSTGWSIVRFIPMREPVVLSYGNVRTEATGKVDFRDTITRGHIIFDGMRSVVRANSLRIDAAAIETPVPSSFTQMARSESGPVMASCCYNAIKVERPETPIEFYAPNSVKRWVTGNGRADKPEVKAMVFEWLGGEFRTNADVTDSIGAAITDALQRVTHER